MKNIERLAPAMVSLFQHVASAEADGRHQICSLVTFADVGDVVQYESADTMEFHITGPYAKGMQPGAADGFVIRARDVFLPLCEGNVPPFRLTLDKRLPVGAGLGDGSAGAAATLGVLCEAFGVDPADARLGQIAHNLGLGVFACFAGEPVVVRGKVDELHQPPRFMDLDAVLVNPHTDLPSEAIFRQFDAMPERPPAWEPHWEGWYGTTQAVLEFLGASRNDLRAAAIVLEPAIDEALAALFERRGEVLLAELSGASPTCFGLCEGPIDAREAALAIGNAHPDWWVKPCRLRGFRPDELWS